ncbi:uncharacterized protein LOC116291935 [Actinia tenebrosa]|uniref:Uncharacterized protein LOC116291935 n=1 Tax=Actinia tenebrosa TaxID=6105 RepID=A0A6P8HF43_ACTTE|nr:uncharacterized protein LOC116291935 [Actinia tenebrosa]
MEASLVLWISLIIKVLLVSRTQGAARFTINPPSVSYVSVGKTIKLVWDYSVDSKREEFGVYSPKWIFYADNGSEFIIAQENVFNQGQWNIQKATCPARLLNPVRVSKESTATLVIHNVTLADSGTYGCVLMLAARSPITNKVKLVVTCGYDCFNLLKLLFLFRLDSFLVCLSFLFLFFKF